MIERRHYDGRVKLNVSEKHYKPWPGGPGGGMHALGWIDILVEYDKRHFKDGPPTLLHFSGEDAIFHLEHVLSDVCINNNRGSSVTPRSRAGGTRAPTIALKNRREAVA